MQPGVGASRTGYPDPGVQAVRRTGPAEQRALGFLRAIGQALQPGPLAQVQQVAAVLARQAGDGQAGRQVLGVFEADVGRSRRQAGRRGGGRAARAPSGAFSWRSVRALWPCAASASRRRWLWGRRPRTGSGCRLRPGVPPTPVRGIPAPGRGLAGNPREGRRAGAPAASPVRRRPTAGSVRHSLGGVRRARRAGGSSNRR